VVTREDVLRAQTTIRGRLHRTPTFSSETLSRLAGARCVLKAELFQRTGSFKPRGVLTKLATLTEEEGRRGVIGISAGNHAQALAWAATAEGIDSLVVMWQGANQAKVDAARGYGASVDLAASGPAEAFERLAELVEETGRTLVHPFDDPAVIAGQGTVALEVLEDVPETTVLLVPAGGGGLVSGIAAAACAVGRRVVAVEPEGSCGLHDGLAAGRSVPSGVASIADGLNAPFAGGNAIELCTAAGVESVLVTDDEIEEGFRFLYRRAKLACEPAGAAAVAALLAGRVALEPGDTVAAVVSGGNAAPETASAILGRR